MIKRGIFISINALLSSIFVSLLWSDNLEQKMDPVYRQQKVQEIKDHQKIQEEAYEEKRRQYKAWQESLRNKRGYAKLHAYLAEVISVFANGGVVAVYKYAEDHGLIIDDAGKVEVTLEAEQGNFDKSDPLFASTEYLGRTRLGPRVKIALDQILTIADKLDNLRFMRPNINAAIFSYRKDKESKKYKQWLDPVSGVKTEIVSDQLTIIGTRRISWDRVKDAILSYGCVVRELYRAGPGDEYFFVKISKDKDISGFLEQILHDPNIDEVSVEGRIKLGIVTR